MQTEELLKLNPKHLDELRSFYAACPFDDFEVFAHESANVEQHMGSFATQEFKSAFEQFSCLHPVGGANRTHFVFGNTVLGDDTFLVSYVSDGTTEDRIIFRIINR